MKRIAIFLFISLSLTGCATLVETLFNWQMQYPDNSIEEATEKIIKRQTGVDIDLTPVTGDERQQFKKK